MGNTSLIKGVELKEIISHPDERGVFAELIRNADPFFKEGFGQLSYSHVHHGVIKGWHGHTIQTQWTYILKGNAKVVLHDRRKGSETFGKTMELLLGENHKSFVYKFPPGVLHGYKCLNGPMTVLYVTSGIYDLNDEVRISFDDKEIGYDWLRTVIK